MRLQLSMLDLWEPKPSFTCGAIDPIGHVLQGDPDETLILPHPRMKVYRARIELHRHTDRRWMWSASYTFDDLAGSSYKIGPKWGRFAETRAGAVHGAASEIINAINGRHTSIDGTEIAAWARRLTGAG